MLIAVLFAAAMVYYHLFLFVPKVLEVRAARGMGNGYSFGGDFYPIWLTSREALFRHRDPYSPEMTRAIQTGLFGRPVDAGQHPLDPPAGYREFAYPGFVDLIFWPVAYLPFPAVRIILAIVLPMMTAGGIWLWANAMRFEASAGVIAVFVPLTLCNYPILEGLFAEQLGLVVGFLLAASMAALGAKKYVLSGVLLAFSTMKPQMTVLLIIFLLIWSFAKWDERHRLAESFIAAETFLCAAAFGVWPRWLAQWLGTLFNYRNYSTPPLIMDLLGPRVGPVLGPVLVMVAIVYAVGVAWRARDRSSESEEFWVTVALILAITVLATLPGHAIYDHIVLLPGIMLAVHFWRRLVAVQGVIRWLFLPAAAVLFWQWVAALTIVSIHPFISAGKFYSVAIFALPIRMAGPFPFALVALLAAVAMRGFPSNLVEKQPREGRRLRAD
jgi:hypothetical protein